MDTQRLRHVVSVTMDVYDTAAVVIMTSLVDGSASRQWVTSALDPSYMHSELQFHIRYQQP